jgi:hypothetical protein
MSLEMVWYLWGVIPWCSIDCQPDTLASQQRYLNNNNNTNEDDDGDEDGDDVDDNDHDDDNGDNDGDTDDVQNISSRRSLIR